MNIKAYVESLELASGETKRTHCPQCNGFKSFTATNNMGQLVWNCYKASCKVSGATQVNLSVDDIRYLQKLRLGLVDSPTLDLDEEFEMPEYIQSFNDLTYVTKQLKKAKAYLETHGLYNFVNYTHYDVKENRLVFPVHSNRGQIVDACGRALDKYRKPKWKRYGKSHHPYTYGDGRTAILVEDCVSAAVVGHKFDLVGVALMGTSLQDGHKQYFNNADFDRIVVALDRDAGNKMPSIASELRLYGSEVALLRLTDDIKYGRPDDMDALKREEER